MTGMLSRAETAELIEELAERLPALPPTERVEVLRNLLGDMACRQLDIYPLPAGFKLSVVIPVYNEERWLRELLRRVRAVEMPMEVILVDDCSTDGTRAILESLQGEP